MDECPRKSPPSRTVPYLPPVRLLLSLCALALAACVVAPPPPAALELVPATPAERALETRRFDTDDEAAVLAGCARVLRAHGFRNAAQEPALGVIVGAKEESAAPRSELRAAIATRPAGEFGGQVEVRVTFQRLVWDARGRETERAGVREAQEYQGFFRELASELALEARPL